MSEHGGVSSDEENEDVAQVVDLLRGVRLENYELKRNFETLKGLHLQLTDSHQQLQRKHGKQQEEMARMEQHYQATCSALQSDLQDKQRQLEGAKAQSLKPRDLEMIKIKMLEEVEGPYKLKCQMLSKEAESAQQRLVQLRREHEELQTSFKSLEARTTSKMDLQEAEHTAVMNQLKDKLASLGNPQAKLSAAESQVRSLLRERDSLAIAVAKQQDELADVRRQKERAVVERESVSFKADRKVKDIQAEELKLHGLVESLTRKNRHQQKELADAHRANEEQFGQLMKASADRTAMQEQLDAVKKAFALEKQACMQQYEEAVHRLEDKLESCRRELHERERQVAELHIAHQEQVSRLVEAHEVRLTEAEAEAAEKARHARAQCTELQAKLEVLKDQCEDYRRECEEHKRKESHRSMLARKEADRLQAAVVDAERQAASLSAEVQQLRKELDSLRGEANGLELNVGHLTRRKEELEGQVAKLHEAAKEAAAHQASLTGELEESRRLLECEKVQALQHMEESRRAAAAEKAALGKKYQVALQEVCARHQEELKRLRKKLKQARGDASQLMEECTELQFKAHDVASLASHRSGAAGLLSTGGPTWASGSGHLLQASSKMSGSACATGVVAVMPDIAALRDRQERYLTLTAGVQS